MAVVLALILLDLEQRPGALVSKRMLRDLIVVESGATEKADFDVFLHELFGDELSQQLRSKLFLSFHHLTCGQFAKTSLRPRKKALGAQRTV